MSTETPFARLWCPLEPGDFETPWTYLRRLAQANLADERALASRIRRRIQATGDPAELGTGLHELAGVHPGHWVTAHQASLHGRRLPGPYERQPVTRLGCIDCHDGVAVEEYPHLRFNICLTHQLWVAFSDPNAQPTVASACDLDYEHGYRELVAAGRLDGDTIDAALRACLLANPTPRREQRTIQEATRLGPDRLQGTNYASLIRALEALADPGAAELLASPRRHDPQRHDFLTRTLADLGPEAWRAVTFLEDHFRLRGQQAAEDRRLREHLEGSGLN